VTRRLAIFDLDNTLLDGDSNNLWAAHLARLGALDHAEYARENQRFEREYNEGTLDIREYMHFTLGPLVGVPAATLREWQASFIRDVIRQHISRSARTLLAEHREAGDLLLVITATNDFVTTPIGRELGVDQLIGSQAVLADGSPTGNVTGTLCYQAGKVQRLREWLEEHGHSLAGSHFYSDSANDIPLLELVDHPFAVNADPRLAVHAAERSWPTMNLRRQN
jgi:HAD superfamily hydrolase (TIGR01490 family)